MMKQENLPDKPIQDKRKEVYERDFIRKFTTHFR